jgi:photosystem II stability/assembly factor-like uncharacterized protein
MRFANRLVFQLGLAMAVLVAGSVNLGDAGINVWTSNGPWGGSITALVVDPQTPTTLYAGTVAGVFKSTNGAGTWSAANSDLTSTFVVALAIDPLTPTLYAGTAGGGVFKSTNGGGSWTAVNNGIPPSSYVGALAIDPLTPTTLYAALFSGAAGGGVFKSTNGGVTWTAVNNGLQVLALAIDPVSPTTLYAGGGGVFKRTHQRWPASRL